MTGSSQTCTRCRTVFSSDATTDTGLCPACRTLDGSAIATFDEPGWFYAVNRQKHGPVSRLELARLAATGQLKPTDMVLCVGTTTWIIGQTVEGVFAEAETKRSAVVPPPTPPPLPATTPAPPPLPEMIQTAVRTGPYIPPLPQSATVPRSSGSATPKIPGFEILEVLGRGGMGVVYKARQTNLKRLVALKMILAGAQAGEHELARFRTEAEAVARLRHPNVVQIYEVGEHDSKPYFALEFVEGGSLAKHLDGKPLPPHQAAALLEPLARAMSAAHQAGIIHRDLKPANVLLAAGNSADSAEKPHVPTIGIPKVADFGLAKRLDDESGQTQTGAVMGTPSYMAPEQAAGKSKEVGPLADVYALGAILYECLTGRPPFVGATQMVTLYLVMKTEPVPPRTFQPDVPRDLETICLKCLEKDPARRYPSAAALADDLQRYREKRPIVARPAGMIERSLKFARRNLLLVGSTAAIFLTLIVALISISIFLGQARAAQGEANKKEKEAKESANRAEEKAEESTKAYLKSIVQSAQMARQRGQLTQALELFDKALKEGHPDTVELLLDKAKALGALSESQAAAKILDELRKRKDQGKFESEILLARADVALGIQTEEAITWIKKALKLGLPPADKEYALALISDSAPECAEHCRKAIELDHYHHSARSVLTLSLLILGRTDETTRVALESSGLYPRDPNFRMILAIVFALRRDHAAVRKELVVIEEQWGKQKTESLAVVLEVLSEVTNWEGMMDDGAAIKLIQVMSKLAPHLKQFFPEGTSLKYDNLANAILNQAKAPPLVARNLMSVIQSVTKLIQSNLDDNALTDMRRLVQIHPEGTLRYIYGMMIFGRWGEARAGEAEEILLQAAKDPAVSSISRSALFGALACESILISPNGTRTPDPEVLKRAAVNVRALYRPGAIHRHEVIIMANVATRTKQYDLARAILTDGEKLSPDDTNITRARVNLLFQAWDFVNVVETAAKLPDDPEIKKIRLKALELLEVFLKNQR